MGAGVWGLGALVLGALVLGALVLGALVPGALVLGASLGIEDAWAPRMAGVRRFQDLDCWRLATELADLCDEMTTTGAAARDVDFRKQLRKSTAKAPAQIAEGFGRYLPRDFANFLRMARASLCESQTHLDRGRRRNYWTPDQVQTAIRLADRAIGATTNLMLDRLREAEKRSRSATARKPRLSRRPDASDTAAPGTDPPGT